jgi:hypothetical protein
MPIPRILESFHQRLPNIPQESVPGNYRATSSSGASTNLQEAIKALFEDNYNVLINNAQPYLPSNPPIPSPFTKSLPQVERTHYLRTEGDVSRASQLYLIHPVNIAAASVIERFGPNPGRLYCLAEHTTSDSRTDFKWTFHPQHGQPRQIAVLELKNTSVLHWDDWRHAFCAPQQAYQKLNAAYNQADFTFLSRNAIVVSKQLNKYHEKVVVDDIAVFDWNKMLLLDFEGANDSSSPPVFPKALFLQEGQGVTFRMVLFAFLIRALRRKHVL